MTWTDGHNCNINGSLDPEVGGHLAPCYIHHMNRVNSSNGPLCHDDSTTNTVTVIYYYIITPIYTLTDP